MAGSYFNKKAGESLFDRVGYYFNASDLAAEIPVVMKKMLG
jgi:NAD(P)H-hydrate repair Nnr-like enzyme with NAD(P)H-hydrate dehydratase domain